jgi:hypothetical protein
MFCTRDIVRYYFRLYILKWRFNINNLVLNIRLYIQVNFLTSVADELIVARGQDIGKGGGGFESGAESWGHNMWEWVG